MRKTDSQLKQDIERELRWDSKVDSARIRVSVDDGAVTLSGVVDTYAQKWSAERATRRVEGIIAIVQDIVVEVLAAHIPTDVEVASAVRRALNWDVFTPESIIGSVRNGAVTLECQVAWAFEREAAEHAIRYLAGVVSVKNNVLVRSGPSTSEVRENIQCALGPDGTIDNRSIHIEVSGGVVTLTGHAPSLEAVEDAVAAARGALGVVEVVDQVMIQITN